MQGGEQAAKRIVSAYEKAAESGYMVNMTTKQLKKIAGAARALGMI